MIVTSGLTIQFGAKPLFENISVKFGEGDRYGLIGANGSGKSTLLRCLWGDLKPDAGAVKWTDKALLGYCVQEHAADFADDMPLTEWMAQWRREGDDDQKVRATLGRLLFSGDEPNKSVKVISGGEEQRMIFGRLMLQKPNVLLLDEPTNHLDMESIESLNGALDRYRGTLIFVSHEREFVSSLATRIIDMKPGPAGGPATVIDFRGDYDEYLASQGLE